MSSFAGRDERTPNNYPGKMTDGKKQQHKHLESSNMKNKIIALLCLVMVWALPSTAKAGQSVTGYGNLRYSINYVDEDGYGIERWKGTDNVSRFGIKGSHSNDLGKAFVHLQVGAPSDKNDDGDGFTQRFFFGGFECEYGKVTYGRMTNAYKFPGFALDPFYDLSRQNTTGFFGGGGATYGLSGATNGFTDNTLQYFTPNFNGFKFVGGIAFEDATDDNEVAWLGGGSYTTNSGLTIGGVYADNPEMTAVYPGIAMGGDAIRAYGTYKGNGWKAGVSYENIDITGYDNVTHLYLTGTAMLKQLKTDLSLSFGYVDDGSAEGFGITAGAFKNILENAQIYAMGSYADLESGYAPYTFSVGAIYNFKFTVKN